MENFFRKYSEHSEDFLEIKKHETMLYPSENGLVKLDPNLYVNLEDYFEVLTSDIGIDLKYRKKELESFIWEARQHGVCFIRKKYLS